MTEAAEKESAPVTYIVQKGHTIWDDEGRKEADDVVVFKDAKKINRLVKAGVVWRKT